MSEINSWYKFGADCIVRILLFIDPIYDITHLSLTCRTLFQICLSDIAAFIWNAKPLAACLNRECGCGRCKMDISFLCHLLSTRKFEEVFICGQMKSFSSCLRALSSVNAVSRLFLSIPRMVVESNPNDEWDIIVPSKLPSFTSLKHFTFSSVNLEKTSVSSCSALLRLLGRSLHTLEFIQSSPPKAMPSLIKYCPKLQRLRVDSCSLVQNECMYLPHSLEEIDYYYPLSCDFQHRCLLPAMKRLVFVSQWEDEDSVVSTVRNAPPTLEELYLGDSEHCATNNVFHAVALSLHKLRCLTVTSEERAQLIASDAMEALGRGCPLLECIDISRALIWFDGGALEVLGRWPSLHRLSLYFSNDTLSRLPSLFASSSTLSHVTLFGADSVSHNSAQVFISAMSHEYPSVHVEFEYV